MAKSDKTKPAKGGKRNVAPPPAAPAASKPYTQMTAQERSRIRIEENKAALRARQAAEANVRTSFPPPAPPAPKPPSRAASIARTALRIAKRNKIIGGLLVAGGGLMYGADMVREATKSAAPAKPAAGKGKPPVPAATKDKNKSKNKGFGRPV